MNTFAKAITLFLSTDRGSRGGQCYCEQRSPLWSHTSARCPAGSKPIESHTVTLVGSREESIPPST